MCRKKFSWERNNAVMFRLKGCPRCGGDIAVNRDIYGWFGECIQCGYLYDLVESAIEFEKTWLEKEEVPTIG